MFHGVTIVCTLDDALRYNVRSPRAVISVFILSPLSDSLSYRGEICIFGKMTSRPLLQCIDCRDVFMYHGFTIVCTLVYALRYDA